ncbi:Kanamycin B dioxygenase [Cytospora mali]|uniref:Kanamycin B dioxygenase n=1 Tax=Cytospora mali TaxID=578113 RepID=A0A194VK66_CYTMA|nr:Kanamycin B dioxygenase [Valsa mali]
MAFNFRPRQVPFKSSTDAVCTLALLNTTQNTLYNAVHPPSRGPSSEEIKKRTLDFRNLEAAVRHIHQDGLVVVKNVIPLRTPRLPQHPNAREISNETRLKWRSLSRRPSSPGITPQRQPAHSDADFAHPSRPFSLVVSIPFVTMKLENGSTKLWLGTHVFGVEGEHGERASGRIRQDLPKGWGRGE